MIRDLREALRMTETPDPPRVESSTEESEHADSDQSHYGPDTPPNRRRGSGLQYNLLDESTDSEDPVYNVIAGPPPVLPTQEAPAPQSPAQNQNPEDTDDTPSPLRTRRGTIRYPPPPPKKRKQEAK